MSQVDYERGVPPHNVNHHVSDHQPDPFEPDISLDSELPYYKSSVGRVAGSQVVIGMQFEQFEGMMSTEKNEFISPIPHPRSHSHTDGHEKSSIHPIWTSNHADHHVEGGKGATVANGQGSNRVPPTSFLNLFLPSFPPPTSPSISLSSSAPSLLPSPSLLAIDSVSLSHASANDARSSTSLINDLHTKVNFLPVTTNTATNATNFLSNSSSLTSSPSSKSNKPMPNVLHKPPPASHVHKSTRKSNSAETRLARDEGATETPRQTIFGSATGRVVAVGGPQNSWDEHSLHLPQLRRSFEKNNKEKELDKNSNAEREETKKGENDKERRKRYVLESIGFDDHSTSATSDPSWRDDGPRSRSKSRNQNKTGPTGTRSVNSHETDFEGATKSFGSVSVSSTYAGTSAGHQGGGGSVAAFGRSLKRKVSGRWRSGAGGEPRMGGSDEALPMPMKKRNKSAEREFIEYSTSSAPSLAGGSSVGSRSRAKSTASHSKTLGAGRTSLQHDRPAPPRIPMPRKRTTTDGVSGTEVVIEDHDNGQDAENDDADLRRRGRTTGVKKVLGKADPYATSFLSIDNSRRSARSGYDPSLKPAAAPASHPVPESHIATSSPTTSGNRLWKLMKRISSGGLREKYEAEMRERERMEAPPVPAMPKNYLDLIGSPPSTAKVNNSASTPPRKDATNAIISNDTPMSPGGMRGMKNVLQGRASVTGSNADGHGKRRPSMPETLSRRSTSEYSLQVFSIRTLARGSIILVLPPGKPPPGMPARSSSPVSSTTIGDNSTKFFNRSQSARSSMSSYGASAEGSTEVPPPLPYPIPSQKPHLPSIPTSLSHSKERGAKKSPLTMQPAPTYKGNSNKIQNIVGQPIIPTSEFNSPESTDISPQDTPYRSEWTVSGSPDDRPSLSAPPRSSFKYEAAAPEYENDNFDTRSHSPSIPSFSTAGTINAFPKNSIKTRRAKSLGPSKPTPNLNGTSTMPPTPLSARGLSPSQRQEYSPRVVAVPAGPPPPRPSRSAQRPKPSSINHSPSNIMSSSTTSSPQFPVRPLMSMSSAVIAPKQPHYRKHQRKSSADELSVLEPPKRPLIHRRSSSFLLAPFSSLAPGSPTSPTSPLSSSSSPSRPPRSRSKSGKAFGIGLAGGLSVSTNRSRKTSLDIHYKDQSSGPRSPVLGLLSSTKLTFRELVSSKVNDSTKRRLTEKEKVERWDDLLEMSNRAPGGTIHLHGGDDFASLPSDQISISASELLS